MKRDWRESYKMVLFEQTSTSPISLWVPTFTFYFVVSIWRMFLPCSHGILCLWATYMLIYIYSARVFGFAIVCTVWHFIHRNLAMRNSIFQLEFWKLLYFGKCFLLFCFFLEIKMRRARNSSTLKSYFSTKYTTSTDLQTNYCDSFSTHNAYPPTGFVLSFQMESTTAAPQQCTAQFYSVYMQYESTLTF